MKQEHEHPGDYGSQDTDPSNWYEGLGEYDLDHTFHPRSPKKRVTSSPSNSHEPTDSDFDWDKITSSSFPDQLPYSTHLTKDVISAMAQIQPTLPASYSESSAQVAEVDPSDTECEDSPIVWKPGQFMTEEFLRSAGISPKEAIGQNFLIDPAALELIASQVLPLAHVLEIGTGPANLTAAMAPRALTITGIEIDPDYAPLHQAVIPQLPNAQVLYQDILRFRMDKWAEADPDALHQVIGNIPFHIAEPLLQRLVRLGLSIDQVTLLTGDNFASLLTASPDSSQYSRMSFLGSLFEVSPALKIPAASFWPVPRTDATVFNLTPLEHALDGNDIALKLRRHLVLHSDISIAKAIKCFDPHASIGGRSADTKASRRQVKQELRRLTKMLNATNDWDSTFKSNNLGQSIASKLNLPDSILSTTFDHLNNQQIARLAQSISSL